MSVVVRVCGGGGSLKDGWVGKFSKELATNSFIYSFIFFVSFSSQDSTDQGLSYARVCRPILAYPIQYCCLTDRCCSYYTSIKWIGLSSVNGPSICSVDFSGT